MFQSRMVGLERLPSRAWGGISARESHRLPEGNPRDRLDRDRGMGHRGFQETSHLLAERTRWNRKIDHRPNHRRKAVRRRTLRGIVLLFERRRGSQRPPAHLPLTGLSACTKVPNLPILAYPYPPIQCGRRA